MTLIGIDAEWFGLQIKGVDFGVQLAIVEMYRRPDVKGGSAKLKAARNGVGAFGTLNQSGQLRQDSSAASGPCCSADAARGR